MALSGARFSQPVINGRGNGGAVFLTQRLAEYRYAFLEKS